MPFPFNSVFDLLNKLEKNRTKSWNNGKIQDLDARTIAAWFNKYNDIIPRRGPEAVAFPIRVNDALSSIFRRLKSPEAKWIVRMLLKDYSPVRIPETAVMHQFHFLLPDLLSFQNSFEAAVKLPDEPTIRCIPFRVARDADNISRKIADRELEPQVGVMIARPAHQKARSIKHCCQLVWPRRMSVERKYDGEYCQIHIDLSRASDSIKIFPEKGSGQRRVVTREG